MSAGRCSSGATRRSLLNADGEQLLAEIGPALDELGQAMERAAGQGELMRLKLAVLPLFASYRLMPRLGELRALHPDLHIDIDTRPHALARLDEGLDAAIVLAREVEPPLYARQARHQPGGRDRRRGARRGPDALPGPSIADATVLLHRDLPDAFDYWREAVGLPDLEPAAIDHFDSGQLILDAAAAGPRRRLHVRNAPRRRARPAPRPAVRRRGREPLCLLVRLPPLGAGPPAGADLPRLAGRRARLGHAA